jgi:CRISPR-associated protein Cas2
MVVMVLQRVPSTLRGELTRWLLEPETGVFVGTVSAMVRDKLWEKCYTSLHGGAMMQIWSTNTEQGFQMRSTGGTRRDVVDVSGLQLVRLPHQKRVRQPSRGEAEGRA